MAENYHHGSLKEALVSAGLRALARENGPELSLRALAGEVGVTVTAAYRHFPSKSDLLLELAAAGFEEMRRRLLAASAKSDPLTTLHQLHSVGEVYVQFARECPALFRLMFDRRGAFDTNDRLKQSSAAAFNVLLECVAAVRGELPQSPHAMKASLAAWSLVHGYAMLTLEGYMDALPEEFGLNVAEVVRTFDPRGVDEIRIPGHTKKRRIRT